jgi:hypothetical protein
LERNKTPGGHGKYAVVRLNKVNADGDIEAHDSLNRLAVGGFVEFGSVGDVNEFFVVKLKDQYAEPALRAYAEAARADDPEYAADVIALADRAAAHPHRKKPD